MNALDQAFYDLLRADTASGGVSEDLTGGWHLDDAPQKTPRPYGIFREAADDPVYTLGNTNAFDGIVYAVQTFAINTVVIDGPEFVGRKADRMKLLFTNGSLAVSGKVVASCRPLRAISPLKERDENDNQFIYSRGWLIELWLT